MNENERELSDAGEVASARECTGLMPALPRTGVEDQIIESLYNIHKSSDKRRKLKAK